RFKRMMGVLPMVSKMEFLMGVMAGDHTTGLGGIHEDLSHGGRLGGENNAKGHQYFPSDLIRITRGISPEVGAGASFLGEWSSGSRKRERKKSPFFCSNRIYSI